MQVTFIFWLPLALSVVGTGFFLFFTEVNWKWKALMAALTVAALALQLVVCVWTLIYWKLNR